MAGKKAGRHSQQANDFLEPKAPTSVTATDVGLNRPFGNGAVTVTFELPANSPAATSFTASGYCSVHNTTHTATGSSSPLTITGFGSEVVTTITVTATNAVGTSPASAPSNSVTVTTVPATPGSPSASSSSAGTDNVSWSAPSNGGKAITNYFWSSSDGKSGNTSSTSVNVGQEQGTAQTYTVYATNANGNSATSSASGSVTTTFSFVPFSVFGFSPFSVFGFSPFGVFGFSPFGFSPFGVFGFSPFGFSPFGFSPFGFSPFGFSPFGVFGFSPGCIHEDTLIAVLSEDGTVGQKAAKDIQTGDYIWAGTFDEDIDESIADPYSWTTESVTNLKHVRTNVANVQQKIVPATMVINGNDAMKYSLEQGIFVKRDNVYSYRVTQGLQVGDYVIEFNPATSTFSEVLVESIDVTEADATVYKFDCEPTDTLIAGNLLVHNLKFY